MSRQRGNVNENQFCKLAEELGYATFCARGSRGPVDVLCFEDHHQAEGLLNEEWFSQMQSLVVQVGTKAKPIAATLRELQEAPRPIGSLCIVARKTKLKNRRVKWLFHTAAGKHDSLSAALEAKER